MILWELKSKGQSPLFSENLVDVENCEKLRGVVPIAIFFGEESCKPRVWVLFLFLYLSPFPHLGSAEGGCYFEYQYLPLRTVTPEKLRPDTVWGWRGEEGLDAAWMLQHFWRWLEGQVSGTGFLLDFAAPQGEIWGHGGNRVLYRVADSQAHGAGLRHQHWRLQVLIVPGWLQTQKGWE